MFLGNALNVPEFEGIIWTGRPRHYRSDCQLGQFKIGSDKLIGKSLNMEVFAFRTIDDELFGYGFQTWLQVLFVDPQNVVSSILFKTESMDNFINLQVDLAAEGKAIGEGIVTATMAKRSTNSGKSYFAVEFSWTERNDDGKRLMEIAAFVGTLNPNQFALPGSVSDKVVEVPAE